MDRSDESLAELEARALHHGLFCFGKCRKNLLTFSEEYRIFTLVDLGGLE